MSTSVNWDFPLSPHEVLPDQPNRHEYGSVCLVVWEGGSREAPPYPDFSALISRA